MVELEECLMRGQWNEVSPSGRAEGGKLDLKLVGDGDA